MKTGSMRRTQRVGWRRAHSEPISICTSASRKRAVGVDKVYIGSRQVPVHYEVQKLNDPGCHFSSLPQSDLELVRPVIRL